MAFIFFVYALRYAISNIIIHKFFPKGQWPYPGFYPYAGKGHCPKENRL